MKRILSFTVILILSSVMAAMAQSFAGRTYKGSSNTGEGTMTMTVKFTSASRGTLTATHGKEKATTAFTYVRSGDLLNITSREFTDYIYIDTDHYYGADAIYMVDDYGKPYIILNRQTAPANSGTKPAAKRPAPKRK